MHLREPRSGSVRAQANDDLERIASTGDGLEASRRSERVVSRSPRDVPLLVTSCVMNALAFP